MPNPPSDRNGTVLAPCWWCQGRGKAPRTDLMWEFSGWFPCRECDGTGQTPDPAAEEKEQANG